jgi:hypothetical protein
MNKQLYTFTQGMIQKYRQGGQIKNTPSTTKLYEEYNFGQIDLSKKHFNFSCSDIIEFCGEIKSLLGIDIRLDPYPSKTTRLATAQHHRNEKNNSYSVSKDFILVNSLAELKINQVEHNITSLTSLGIYLKATDIQSIEHSAIVLVENLAVMAHLNAINISSVTTNIDLTQALWVYRGDVKPQQTTNTSYQFFRRFNGVLPLVCFSDLDPKGIEIALTSEANYWLTLKNLEQLTIPLSGNEQEWYQQHAAKSFLESKLEKHVQKKQEEVSWIDYYNLLNQKHSTLKQEHMLQHQLALNLVAF